MAWRLERHDDYIPEDWGVEPIRLVDDEGKTVADNVAFYPHGLTREHADAILAMQARLAAPSLSPAPDVMTFDQWWNASKYRQVIYAGASKQQIARDGWDAALASLSQPAKGEREGGE